MALKPLPIICMICGAVVAYALSFLVGRSPVLVALPLVGFLMGAICSI